MYCLLGYNGRTSTPGSWDASDITSVQTVFISEGNTFTYDLTGTNLPAALQSGAARSITFGPGSSFNLNNYGFFAGTNSGQGPQLDIDYHTGSAPVKAGNGGTGLVTITYASSSVLICAISPLAGTDGSNAFGAGYTGTVQAFQPASSPTAVETWHNVTPPSGWSGVCRYKKVAELNLACVDFQLTHAGASGNINVLTLPSGYLPATNHVGALSMLNNTAPANDNKRFTVNTTGVVQTYALPASTTAIYGTLIYPLD
jgi:hypothetical protein